MCVICAALVAAVPKESAAFEDGNDLLEHATSDKPWENLAYFTYVIGVRDGFSAALQSNGLNEVYCTTGHPHGDVGDAVRIWLRRNPQLLDWTPQGAVIVALKESFPCEAGADDE